jgi:hypothetical protein
MALEKDKLQDSSQKKDVDVKQPFSGENGDLEGAQPEGHSRYGTSDRSVGGRIAPVLPHLANYDFGNDDTGSDILGKQIELEAGNDIQYRTCSWPKVDHHR